MMARRQSFFAASADWRLLLKNRDVVWLVTGQAISQIGDGLSKLALLWFVYDLTGSALEMTMIGILQTIPPFVFGPFVGVLLDRVPKRSAMIVIDSVRAGLLAFIPTMYWMGLLTLPWLYVLVFITAMFSMAFGPALKAMEPQLVPSNQLTQINALDQGTMTIGQLLGPAISGMLIAFIGAQNVLYVNAGTFLVSALCKIPLTVKEKWQSGSASARHALRDLWEGFQFVFVDHRLMLLLMAVASLSTVGATAFIYLLPVLAKDYLHADSVELGWLWASLSLGLLVTTLWMAVVSQRDLCPRLRLIAGASALGSLAVFSLTMTTSFPILVALIAMVGVCSGVVNPFISASIQERTPKHMMARVFSVFNSGVLVAAMVGMTGSGWIADRMGPSASLLATAGVGAAAAVLTAVLIPWCRRLRA
ncbi:MAG: MFS transporter [Nitrospirota bacterium]